MNLSSSLVLSAGSPDEGRDSPAAGRKDNATAAPSYDKMGLMSRARWE